MKFLSKKSVISGLIIWGVILVPMAHLIYENVYIGPFEADAWIGLIIVGALFILIIVMWFGTYYIVTGDKLEIYGGYIKFDSIDIARIVSIKQTYNPLSAPALTFRRLEIKYDRWGMALISPKDEKYFIELLLEKNEAISIDERLR